MLDNNHLYDITIIGGGPVGMFAAYYAGMRNADVQLIESLPELGGQVKTLYAEKNIFDVAGFPGITGEDLTQNLTAQLDLFQPTLKLQTSVQNFKQDNDGTYLIETDRGTTRSKGIIIAIGNGAFTPRKLAFDYDQTLEDKQIQYFVKNTQQYQDKTIAIAGGGDSAIDWALALEKVAKKVYLIHRREQFRGLESSVNALKQSNINLLTPYLIKSAIANKNQLSLGLNQVKSDHIEPLLVDHLLVNYGFLSDTKLLKSWQLELNRHQIKVDQTLQTNQQNVYAIGDIADYPGKVKLIASGFGEAPTAVTSLLNNLYPDKRQPLHSTSIM